MTLILPHRDFTPMPLPALWVPSREILRRPRLQRAMDPVQFTTNNSAATTALVVTLAGSPQVGNTLFACVFSNNSGVTSITGGGAGAGADAWTAVPPSPGGVTDTTDIWRCVVTGTPGTAITINTPSARIDGLVAEFEGRYTTDQTGQNSATGTAVATSSLTPLAPTELVLALAGAFASFGAVGGGFTGIGGTTSGTMSMVVAMLRAGPIAARSATWTIGASVGWDTQMATFKTTPYMTGVQVEEVTDSVASA